MARNDGQLGSEELRIVVGIIAGLGALNWGLIEFIDFDLFNDIVSLGSTETQLIVGVVAAAGFVVAYNAFQKFSG